jgi:hypothetical protein
VIYIHISDNASAKKRSYIKSIIHLWDLVSLSKTIKLHVLWNGVSGVENSYYTTHTYNFIDNFFAFV